MASTFLGLEIARRSLQAHTRAMDITAHNISNASRTGYSRQRSVFTAATPFSSPSLLRETGAYQLGAGVDIAQVQRVRDGYLDVQMRNTLANVGQYEEEAAVLGRVEAMFPEPSDFGIRKFLDDFFGSWYDLSQNPDNPPAEVVYGAGKALADSIRVAYGQLQALRDEVNNAQIGDQLQSINELGQKIARLNHEIGRQMQLGNTANDLMDQRDTLLDELAKFGPLTVAPVSGGFGAVTVVVMGHTLVDGSEWESIAESYGYAEAVDVADFTDINVPPGDPLPAGSLPALLALVDKLDGYMADLDNLAITLTQDVNAYAQTAFFTGSGAADFAVNGDKQTVIADLKALQPQHALNVAQLEPEIGNLYADLLTRIGSDLNAAKNNLGLHNAVVQQVGALRQSVMGVSIDEELTNMMQFQYAYQASARVVTIIDEMLDTLINKMR